MDIKYCVLIEPDTDRNVTVMKRLLELSSNILELQKVAALLIQFLCSWNNFYVKSVNTKSVEKILLFFQGISHSYW